MARQSGHSQTLLELCDNPPPFLPDLHQAQQGSNTYVLCEPSLGRKKRKKEEKHAADRLQSFGMYDAAVLKSSGIRAHLYGVRVHQRSFSIYVLMNKVLSKGGV